MDMVFNCKNCDFDFEVKSPLKKEYTYPVFGPCSNYVAYCPKCNAECSEKPRRKPQKKDQASMPLFRSGGCGCGNGFCG